MKCDEDDWNRKVRPVSPERRRNGGLVSTLGLTLANKVAGEFVRC